VSAAELSAITAGRVRPSLKTLVLCELARPRFASGTGTASGDRTTASQRRDPSRGRRRPSDVALRKALDATLAYQNDRDLPSLRAFARGHQVTPAYLRTRFRDSTDALIERRFEALQVRRRGSEEAVRAVVLASLERIRRLGIAFTRRQLEDQVGKPGLLRVPYVRAIVAQPEAFARAPERVTAAKASNRHTQARCHDGKTRAYRGPQKLRTPG